MAYYMSMQTVRFRSLNDYEQFRMLFSNVGEHLKKIDGFVHLTWWAHPEDPNWFNEISIWTSKEATQEWHDNGYHKYLKKWGLTGVAIENVITNWECVESKIMRLCPVCNHGYGGAFELKDQAATLETACPQCGFRFPRLQNTRSNFALLRE